MQGLFITTHLSINIVYIKYIFLTYSWLTVTAAKWRCCHDPQNAETREYTHNITSISGHTDAPSDTATKRFFSDLPNSRDLHPTCSATGNQGIVSWPIRKLWQVITYWLWNWGHVITLCPDSWLVWKLFHKSPSCFSKQTLHFLKQTLHWKARSLLYNMSSEVRGTSWYSVRFPHWSGSCSLDYLWHCRSEEGAWKLPAVRDIGQNIQLTGSQVFYQWVTVKHTGTWTPFWKNGIF